jgi:hypothetical protein
MFGYIKSDFPNLYVKDVRLYKAMYCGLCKGIGKVCGTNGRFALSYDLAFLSILVHNLTNQDVNIEDQNCIIHPIAKRPIAIVDKITEAIASLNVILAQYKLCDDVLDSGKGRTKRALLSSSYKRAKKSQPKLDEIVSTMYKKLVEYEKTNGDSIDISADPFGVMMQEILAYLLGEYSTEETSRLSYCMGKWIYLIDALDDYDKDKKKGNYNVFINAYKDATTKQELIDKHGVDISVIFGSLLDEVAFLATKLQYKFNHDLINNVLLGGLKNQTKLIMENKKCKNTTKF